MSRVSRGDIESRWYDCFSGWTCADREAAMKVLATLHRHLPADPRAKQPNPAEAKADKTSDHSSDTGEKVNVVSAEMAREAAADMKADMFGERGNG